MTSGHDFSKLLEILEKLAVGMVAQRAVMAGLLAEQPESKVAAIFRVVSELADEDEPGAGMRDAALMRSAWDELLAETQAFAAKLSATKA